MINQDLSNNHREKKKILLVTYDLPASDRRSWSGISYSVKKELEKEFTVYDYCINVKKSFLAMIKVFYYRYVKKSNISIKLLRPLAKTLSKTVDKISRDKKCDCVVVMGAQSSGAISYSESKVPKLFFSDCVITQAVDYYWFGVDKKVVEEYYDVQKKALVNSSAVILNSNWAKAAAIDEYGTSADKITVIPLGANVEVNDFRNEHHEGINLLFNGVDWKRKGGDIAVECVEKLNKLDPASKYTLHIVGCNPPGVTDDEHIKIYGFLNRNIKEERELLDHLRENADFFILPTHAECAGIVFCEACAYGIPSITFDTGGVGDYVRNDINGYRLPVGSSAEDFAKKIIEYVSDSKKTEELQRNARYMYETELNWKVIVEKFRKLINQQI